MLSVSEKHSFLNGRRVSFARVSAVLSALALICMTTPSAAQKATPSKSTPAHAQNLPPLNVSTSTEQDPVPASEPAATVVGPLSCIMRGGRCVEISELALVEAALDNKDLRNDYKDYLAGEKRGTFADYMYRDLNSLRWVANTIALIGIGALVASAAMFLSSPWLGDEMVMFASLIPGAVGIAATTSGFKWGNRLRRQLRGLNAIRYRERHELPGIHFIGTTPQPVDKGINIAASLAF